jgi:hypothetical protein
MSFLLLAWQWRKAIAIGLAVLSVFAYHKSQVSAAYKAGYAAAVEVQREAMTKDRANADKAVNLKTFVDCHARQNNGEKVIWDRENQSCEKLP